MTVPSQFAGAANGGGTPQRVLRIIASEIPSVGYKVFEVRPGAAPSFASDVKASGDVLENSFYRVRLDGRGAIESLVSKALGGREMAAKIDDRSLNDLGAGVGTVTVRDAGSVSVTLHAETSGELPRSTDVTVFRGIDRIAIRNEIDGNFTDVKTWAFSFNLRAPDVWHEEVGAINHARLKPEGDYAAKFSKLDWLTLNHFVSMSGDDGAGVTLSNGDDAFMKLGHSDIAEGISTLDTKTPQINVLAGGQVHGRYLGIQNQGGDKHFVQRFALRVQSHLSAAESMRFALEDQNPLVAGAVTGDDGYPETAYSLLSSSNPNVMLWALKPAEEGIDRGIVARFWNLAPTADSYTVKLEAGIASARSITHIETLPKTAPLVGRTLHVRANSWQLQSFELSPATHPRGTN
jgi:alpha-mannosidase